MDSTIRSIAESLNINYSTAKTILSTYRKEGRVKKKKSRVRKNRSFKKGEMACHELVDFFDFTRYEKEINMQRDIVMLLLANKK